MSGALAEALASERCNGCGQPRSKWGPVCGSMLQGDMTHYHSATWWEHIFADPLARPGGPVPEREGDGR